VALADDGGFLQAKVADKDGNPIPHSYVFVLPAAPRSEAALASMMISGQTDQNGIYSSVCLAPGKYVVLANSAPIDPIPASIARLWSARSKAKEVEVGAGMAAQVTMEPMRIE
jgi:hypothetical protein